jgi:hypothetical protein
MTTRLDEIRKRVEQATPGPWERSDFAHAVDDTFEVKSRGKLYQNGYPSLVASEADRRDANFIAHAREDIPWLIAEVERLQMELAEARKQRDHEATRRASAFKELERTEEEVERLREPLSVIDYTARSRGYPTPKDWDELVRLVREALRKETP